MRNWQSRYALWDDRFEISLVPLISSAAHSAPKVLPASNHPSPSFGPRAKRRASRSPGGPNPTCASPATAVAFRLLPRRAHRLMHASAARTRSGGNPPIGAKPRGRVRPAPPAHTTLAPTGDAGRSARARPAAQPRTRCRFAAGAGTPDVPAPIHSLSVSGTRTPAAGSGAWRRRRRRLGAGRQSRPQPSVTAGSGQGPGPAQQCAAPSQGDSARPVTVKSLRGAPSPSQAVGLSDIRAPARRARPCALGLGPVPPRNSVRGVRALARPGQPVTAGLKFKLPGPGEAAPGSPGRFLSRTEALRGLGGPGVGSSSRDGLGRLAVRVRIQCRRGRTRMVISWYWIPAGPGR
jgi:hypothetical protein